MRRMKRFTAVCIALIMAVTLFSACLTESDAASKTKKMTVYTQVMKSKSTVYCTDNAGIYKVNLKTGKVKRIAKILSFVTTMKLKNGYVYYLANYEAGYSELCRVKTTGKKKKRLAADVSAFAIKGSKIYYREYYMEDLDDEDYTYRNKKMKLNGKSKKGTSYRPVSISKKTNAKGYKVIKKYSEDFSYNPDGYMISYLKKPNGKKIKLGKYKAIDLWA